LKLITLAPAHAHAFVFAKRIAPRTKGRGYRAWSDHASDFFAAGQLADYAVTVANALLSRLRKNKGRVETWRGG
jgi:hypothetical protein